MKNLLTKTQSTRRTAPRKDLGLGLLFGAVLFLFAAGNGPAWGGEVAPDTADSAVALRWDTVVPRPSHSERGDGTWNVGSTISVTWGPVTGAELADLSERLDRIWKPLGRTWKTAKPGEPPDLVFSSGVGAEPGSGYDLDVRQDGISVQSSSPAGRYYALITLTQLLPPSARTVDPLQVAVGQIHDQPAFGWRGLMLDSSRHFQSVETIEWILELMALHKLNRFHWHLTDDQGWRLPVVGWPRLTEVGGWRVEADGRPYGGAYTPEDIRKIVAFAARRQIIVVPEVDLPGHASAALAAYPELSASGAPREVPLDWGVADGVLSIGRKSVAQFTSDVLSTLTDLFPGPWIHWGGDEVYRTPWMKNPESQLWMKTVKAATPKEALAAFWSDLAQKTLVAGKIPIGWDEIALQGVPTATVVQWWDDPARAMAAFREGHAVIASWKETSYLDYPEWDGDGDRAVWMPVQTLNTVAAQPFWPPGTPESARHLLLGVEAGLWTERAPEPKLGRKLFPRLALVADLAWAGAGGDPDWAARIAAHRTRLELWGVGMPPPAR